MRRTGIDGNYDIYTIFFSNGETFEFRVKNAGPAEMTKIELEGVPAFFADAGIENVEAPAYECIDLAPSFKVTVGEDEDDKYIKYSIQTTDAVEKEEFVDAMKTAGWAVIDEPYPGDYEFAFGNTLARASIIDNLSYSSASVDIRFYLAVEYPAAAIAKDLAAMGVTDELPLFSGTTYNYMYMSDESECSLFMHVGTGNEETAIAQYVDDLKAANYTEGLVDSYDVQHYLSPNNQLNVVVDYTPYISGYFYVTFKYAGFPSKTIAADLENAGCPEMLPAFTGVALDYYYYSSGSTRQLAIYVEENGEQAAIAKYQSDLLTAGFSEAGKDKYGDMHYSSPNKFIDVCAWDGNDDGAPGMIFVDIVLNLPKTPYEAISSVASKVRNARVYQNEDGSYYTQFTFQASAYSVADMKGLVKSTFTPSDFELYTDWTADTLEDGTNIEYCVFLNAAGTVLQYVVYSSTIYVKDGYIVEEGTEGAVATDVTILKATAYTAQIGQ